MSMMVYYDFCLYVSSIYIYTYIQSALYCANLVRPILMYGYYFRDSSTAKTILFRLKEFNSNSRGIQIWFWAVDVPPSRLHSSRTAC